MARGHGRQNGREKVDEGMDVEVTDGGGSDAGPSETALLSFASEARCGCTGCSGGALMKSTYRWQP